MDGWAEAMKKQHSGVAGVQELQEANILTGLQILVEVGC